MPRIPTGGGGAGSTAAAFAVGGEQRLGERSAEGECRTNGQDGGCWVLVQPGLSGVGYGYNHKDVRDHERAVMETAEHAYGTLQKTGLSKPEPPETVQALTISSVEQMTLRISTSKAALGLRPAG